MSSSSSIRKAAATRASANEAARGPLPGSRGKVRSPQTQAVQDDESMRAYVERLASDKRASVTFLKEAGILDAKGGLAKPYRG